MENQEIKFKFNGDNFTNNEFEIKELGVIFESIGEMIECANKNLSSESQIKVNINSKFNPGSFEFVTEIYQFINSSAIPALAGMEATSILNLYTVTSILFSNKGSLFELLRFLKGQIPTKTENKEDNILVFRNDGVSLEVKKDALMIFEDKKVRKAIGLSIANSLSKNGTDSLEITTDDYKNKIDQKDSEYFSYNQDPEDDFLDVETMETELEIGSISFDPEKKWEFRNYKDTFSAEIESQQFKEKIESGEIFQKGDRLKTILQTEYYKTQQQIRKRKIIAVIDHISPPVQNELFDQQ
jgi:hypothetical protein